MAKWDVIFSHRASSRTVKKTVDAESKTQAVLAAQAKFDEPDQWAPVAATEVPAGYYEKIARWANNLDAEIEDKEERMERQRESFAAYNEE